jgi:hypothetical protein
VQPYRGLDVPRRGAGRRQIGERRHHHHPGNQGVSEPSEIGQMIMSKAKLVVEVATAPQ